MPAALLIGSEELVRVHTEIELLEEKARTAWLHVDESSIEDLLEEDLQKLVLVLHIRMAGNLRIREKLRSVLHADRWPSCSCMQWFCKPPRKDRKDRICTSGFRMDAEVTWIVRDHLLR